MPISLPNDVWLKIWSQHDDIRPTPPVMGRLRGLSRQYQDVMDDNAMWTLFTPGLRSFLSSRREVFMEQIGRRSARGNRCLADVYEGRMVPTLSPQFVGKYYFKQAAFRELKTSATHDYDIIKKYLLLGPLGRDDVFDAASALRAPRLFWQDFSQNLRNEPAIIWRAAALDGGILAYVGSDQLTPDLVTMAVATSGDMIGELPAVYRRSHDIARLAIKSSSGAFEQLDDETCKDRTLALLHVATHPTEAWDAIKYFNDDKEFYPLSVCATLTERAFKEKASPQICNDRDIHLRLVSQQAAALRWFPEQRYSRDASFLQKAYHMAQDLNQRQALYRCACDTLQQRWGTIDGPDFINPEEPQSSPST